MFYKNILETVPIFMFGTLSKFSGTLIYNDLLYQSYNTFYTCLPIIWFATCDFEYPKKLMVSHPRFYKIGMANIYFNSLVFWRWIFYGLWQSSLILFLAFFLTNFESPDQTGMYAGIWVSGEFVYMMIVIVANVKILVSSYLINMGILVTIIASILLYIFSYSMISGVFVLSPDYGTMYMMFS